MTVNKRKKNSRQRGSWTHGWGEKKKHRGAGSRGGRGFAGSGKRGDAKKPSFWKVKYFSKKGFKKKGQNRKDIPVNIKMLNNDLPLFKERGIVTEENGVVVIDFEKTEYTKLIGGGTTNKRFKVIIPSATEKAILKIKSSGGEVVTKRDGLETNN